MARVAGALQAVAGALTPQSASTLVGVGADGRRRALDRAGGGREARRRGRLRHAVHLDEGLARGVVRMAGASSMLEHGGETDVGGVHDRAPLVAGLGLNDRRQLGLQRRPLARGPSAP